MPPPLTPVSNHIHSSTIPSVWNDDNVSPVSEWDDAFRDLCYLLNCLHLYTCPWKNWKCPPCHLLWHMWMIGLTILQQRYLSVFLLHTHILTPFTLKGYSWLLYSFLWGGTTFSPLSWFTEVLLHSYSPWPKDCSSHPIFCFGLHHDVGKAVRGCLVSIERLRFYGTLKCV